MRQITKDAIEHFYRPATFQRDNTEVELKAWYEDAPQNKVDCVLLKLHGNVIAYYSRRNGKLFITNAGWKSNVTKERLNALHSVNICQKDFVWYLNGAKWDGNWIEIEY